MKAGAARKASAVITVAFLVSSGLGFVLLALVARWLSPEQNAQFLAVWALVFGIGAAMSAVDAECSRLASRASLDQRAVSGQVGIVALTGGLGGLVAVLVISLVPGVGAILTSSPGVMVWTIAGVVLFAPLCLARGVLIGTGHVGPYVWVVLGEALVRVVVAAGLVSFEPSLSAAIAAVAVGGLAWLPIVHVVAREVHWRSRRRSVRAAIASVGALGSANALSSLLLAGYPVLVTTLVGGTKGLQTLFAAVVLTRLPLAAISPVQAVAVPVATRALYGGHVSLLRRTWARAAGSLVALAAAAFAAGWYLGPGAMRVFQGPGYDAEPAMMAVLLSATCVLAVALPQLSVMVAAGRHIWVTAAWSLAVLVAAAWLVLGPGGPESRGTVAFALGAMLTYVCSSIGLLTATRDSRFTWRGPAASSNGKARADVDGSS